MRLSRLVPSQVQQYYTRMCIPETKCVESVEIDTVQPLQINSVVAEEM